jgi:hypothetical protein
MVIGDVAGQDAAEGSLAQNEHVIQALAPDRADLPFREGILPRTPMGGADYQTGKRELLRIIQRPAVRPTDRLAHVGRFA